MKNGIFNNPCDIIKRFYLFYFIQILFLIILFPYIRITEGRSINVINHLSEINLVVLGNGSQNLLSNSFYLEPSEVIVNGISRDSCKFDCELE